MHYRIDDADGNELVNGLGESDWERVAHNKAVQYGKTVYVSQEGDGADEDWNEDVSP